MGKVTTLNYFGALPGRASHDRRLTALHFRVLLVIAGHDRMGRNGQCCWAGRKKLAARVGCDPSSLSSAISDLVDMEYLQEERHENDGRKKGFRVIYKAEEDAPGIGIEFQKNRFPDENLSDENRLADENLSAGDRFPDRNISRDEDPTNTQQKQCVESYDRKPNILRRNKTYKSEDSTYRSEDQKYHPQKHHPEVGKKLYGPNTHATIVQALGPDGWGILTSLPPPMLEYLEQRVTDGTLNDEDLMIARREAREAAHG